MKVRAEKKEFQQNCVSGLNSFAAFSFVEVMAFLPLDPQLQDPQATPLEKMWGSV